MYGRYERRRLTNVGICDSDHSLLRGMRFRMLMWFQRLNVSYSRCMFLSSETIDTPRSSDHKQHDRSRCRACMVATVSTTEHTLIGNDVDVIASGVANELRDQ
jgi:hypothetical protein